MAKRTGGSPAAHPANFTHIALGGRAGPSSQKGHYSPREFSVSGSIEFIEPGRLALVSRDLGLPPLRRDFDGEAPIESPGR